jgi:transposase-like protein
MNKKPNQRSNRPGEPGKSPAGQSSSPGRFSAQKKLEAVQRLNRGESLEDLSRELGVTAATLSQWQEIAQASALQSLQSRPSDGKDSQIQALKAKIGDQAMEIELLYDKVHKLEAQHPLVMRRWRR